ncbi:MAG: hypothetical protein AAFV33_05560 [Chloroflexota bacterium]
MSASKSGMIASPGVMSGSVSSTPVPASISHAEGRGPSVGAAARSALPNHSDACARVGSEAVAAQPRREKNTPP